MDNEKISKISTFVITLIDPCDQPTSILIPTLTDQVYQLGNTNAPSYVIPDIVIDPSYCPFELMYDITLLEDSLPNSAITRNDQTFYFEYSTDTAPLNQIQTVTITASSSSIYDTNQVAKTVTESFDLTFELTCGDGDLINLTAKAQIDPASDEYTGNLLEF